MCRASGFIKVSAYYNLRNLFRDSNVVIIVSLGKILNILSFSGQVLSSVRDQQVVGQLCEPTVSDRHLTKMELYWYM